MDDNGPCPGTDGQNLTLKLNRQLRLSRKDCKDLVVMHAIMQQGHLALLCKMDDNGPCPGTDGQNLTLKLNRQLRLSRKDCKDLVVMHAIMQQGHQLA